MDSGEEGKEGIMKKVWRAREDYRPLLKEACRLYPTYLEHVKSKRIFLCGVRRKGGRYIAQIHRMRPPFSLLSPNFDYVIEVDEKKFDKKDRAYKIYVFVHELMHTHRKGFDPNSSDYRRLVEHDTEEFNYLLVRCGIRMENVEDILKGEAALLKSHRRKRFPRYEVIH